MNLKWIVWTALVAQAFVPGGLFAQQRATVAPAGGKELVAIIEFAAEGASKAEVAALTDRLQDLLLRSGKFALVDRGQMDAILKEQAFQQTGCTSQECAVKVGKVLGVKKIVVGRVVKLGDTTWQLAAQLLDVETAETTRAESLPHRGDFFSLLDQATVTLAARLTGAAGLAGAPVAQSQSAQQAPVSSQPSSVVREPIIGMEFAWVPGGSFEMGCHSNAGDCYDDEKPVRTVRVNGFWLGKTEVSQGQWQKVMGDNPSTFKKGDNYPVEQVSWDEAQQFIIKLNAQGGGVTFRLPTEAEWEYACRGGGKSVRYGTQTGGLLPGLAKYDSKDSTVPVGSYPANALGLHDMSGNVAEWVQDTYDSGAYRTPGADNPINQGSHIDRVVRGGGWDANPREVRCSNRDWDEQIRRDVSEGLRLVKSP